MALLIQNGTIVTARKKFRGDIYCANEKITRIGKRLRVPDKATVVDATGQFVFPGFIDPHVHIYLPVMGTQAKDTYESASQAAVTSGTTTLIEMCTPSRRQPVLKSFERWLGRAEGKSACDFTFHMGVARYDKTSVAELRKIVDAGISSFKIYLAYKGAYALNDYELYHVMRMAKEWGVIVTAHCENADIVAELQKKLIHEGKTGTKWHYWSRPPMVEAGGVRRLASFAEVHGTHVYVVHTSCREALQAALDARSRGVNIWIEHLIQHLTLDQTFAERSRFQGAKYIMSPPLRDKGNHAALWKALAGGESSTVASDHAPFDFKDQKQAGRHDFTKIPSGLPTLEHRIPLLWTRGVCEGRLNLHRFVDVASTQAAKIFGLYPRKGAIAVGSDADLVVWDPSYNGRISARKQYMNVDYNPFEGWPVKGRASTVTVRGEIVAEAGRFTGRLGRGQLLRREPNH